MSPNRKDRVAPPAGPGQWEVRYAKADVVKGWEHLCQQAEGNTRRAWETLSNSPVPVVESPRHHRMKGALRSGTFEGRELPQWQYEVTGGGRIWYLVDEERTTVWIRRAGTGHPKATD